jgi:hypothetical protein
MLPGILLRGKHWVIDPTKRLEAKGRYLNHSGDPNCYVKVKIYSLYSDAIL